jgi:hypothetical protein
LLVRGRGAGIWRAGIWGGFWFATATGADTPQAGAGTGTSRLHDHARSHRVAGIARPATTLDDYTRSAGSARPAAIVRSVVPKRAAIGAGVTIIRIGAAVINAANPARRRQAIVNAAAEGGHYSGAKRQF